MSEWGSTSKQDVQCCDERSPLISQVPVTGLGERNLSRKPSSQLQEKAVSPAKLRWIMASVWIGTFCAGLDATLIATLGSSIATEFHSLSLYAWLATTYLIATAATQPLSGKLTDIYSRRNGLLLCNILFATGNLVCGLAQDPTMMIIGRALAGLGGGGLNAISTIVASDLIPLRQRGLWQGVSNVCWGLGNGLGGVFGGFLNDVWDWKLAFLVQLPLTAASLIMITINLEQHSTGVARPKTSKLKRVDFLGSLLLVSTLVLLLLGLNSGGNIVSWHHPLVLTSLPLSAILLIAFIVAEEKFAPEPIIPVRLILNRTVASACLTNWFFLMIAYALDFYVVVYFRVRGLSATQAGACLIPFSVTTAAGSLLAGIITSRSGRYKALNIAILLLMLLATILIATSSFYIPIWTTVFALGVAGIAIGGMLTVTLVALIGAVSHEEQALVTSLSYAFRSTGSVIGVAMASAVFQNVLSSQLWASFGSRTDAAGLISRLKDSLDEIKVVPTNDQPLVEESYVRASQAVFLTLVGLAILGLISGLLMREFKLSSRLDRQDEDGEI
ncbi:major facilitator superfamily domain-containing protein [Usnea florida]